MSVSEYNFPNQTNFYKGKVRDVYSIGEDKLVIVASDRVSAFDVILPKGIPFKGQILSKIAAINLKATEDILPNWLEKLPHPNVSIGKKCDPFKIEMVIRGYLAGHAWREYKAGKRIICGVTMPDGLKENDKFPSPIITPATKAEEGHDEDISREEIIAQGIVSKEDYEKLETFTYKLFQRGTELAEKMGLILVDTKYEFGKIGDEIYLIDEIHTPDSSRYFYADSYQDNQEKELPQKHLSKEFVREWLMEHGFQGKDGQQIPEMTQEVVDSISNRYKELYAHLTGESFEETSMKDIEKIIIANVG